MKRTDKFSSWKFSWVGSILMTVTIVLALPHPAPALVMTQPAFSVPNHTLIKPENISDKQAALASSCADPACMGVHSNCINKLKEGEKDTECINKTMACQESCAAKRAAGNSAREPEPKPVAKEISVEETKRKSASTPGSDCWNKSSPIEQLGSCESIIKTGQIDGKRASNEQLAKAYYHRGMLSIKEQKAYRVALDDCNKAISLHKDYADAYVCRGDANKKLGQYQQALADLKTAMKLTPGDAYYSHKVATTYADIGWDHSQAKNYKAAIAAYTQAIGHSKKKDLAALHANRGRMHEHLKAYDQAIADYRKALHFRPTYNAIKKRMEALLKLAGQTNPPKRHSQTPTLTQKPPATTSRKSKLGKYPFFSATYLFRPSDVDCEFGTGWRGVGACSLLIEVTSLIGELDGKHFAKFPKDIRKREKPENKAKLLTWRGGVLEGMRLNDLAIADYQLALHLDPNNTSAAEALDGLGVEKKFKADDEKKCYSGSPSDIPLCSRALAMGGINGSKFQGRSRIFLHANRGLAFLRLNLPELAIHDFERAIHAYYSYGRGINGVPAKVIFDIYNYTAKSAERQGEKRVALRYLVAGLEELLKHKNPKYDDLVKKYKAEMRLAYEGHKVSAAGFEVWFNCAKKDSFFDCTDPVPGADDGSYCSRKTGGQATIDACERYIRTNKLLPKVHANIHKKIGINLIEMREFGRAEKHCDKAATLYQSGNYGKFCYGRLYEAKGQVAKAKAAYEDVLQSDIYHYIDLAKRMRAVGVKPLPPYQYKSYDELDDDCYEYDESCEAAVEILDSWLKYNPHDKEGLAIRKEFNF